MEKTNSYIDKSNLIQLLDRYFDFIYKKNTIISWDYDDFKNFVINLWSKNLDTYKELQSKTIKKIASIFSWKEIDDYFKNHTGWESYERVNERFKQFEKKRFFFWDLVLMNNDLLKNVKKSKNMKIILPWFAENAKKNKYQSVFWAIEITNWDNKTLFYGFHTLDSKICQVFLKFPERLKNFFKILLLSNHDWFHNIDIFDQSHSKRDLDIVNTVNNFLTKWVEPHQTIPWVNELEYASLKEHQMHFMNFYQSNPEFKNYILWIFEDFIQDLEYIENISINDYYHKDLHDATSYLVTYALTFFGRLRNIYEDNYFLGIMEKYKTDILLSQELVIKSLRNNDHFFNTISGNKLSAEDFYKKSSPNI